MSDISESISEALLYVRLAMKDEAEGMDSKENRGKAIKALESGPWNNDDFLTEMWLQDQEEEDLQTEQEYREWQEYEADRMNREDRMWRN